MKILYRGGKRAVQGVGLVNHGDELEVNDTEGARLLGIRGFVKVSEEPAEPTSWECEEHSKTYKTREGYDAHMVSETYHPTDEDE